ncbi:hypothetical protein TNCV_5038461 [Trichonephila clavipes]|nr:hypothetical protein TNCV_5038461 [Trichonephila clavipes]
MNPVSNCVLTIIEDVSGDVQDSVLILFSLLHVTQALNQELWCEVPFVLTARPLWSSLELVKYFLGQPDRQISGHVEHVWDMKGRRLRLLGNVDALTQQLEQMWQEIPQETIRVPYHSMQRRLEACIQAIGGSTLYRASYFVTM